MKKIIYMLMLLAMPWTAAAQEVNMELVESEATELPTRMTKEDGDKAYNEKRFSDAIDIYETLIKEQGGTLQLYYNLGNAYYRENLFGKAVLNYERALKIDANDVETKENLKLVQDNKLVDKIEHEEASFFKRIGNSIFGIFSMDTWAFIGVVAFMAMLVSLFFYYFRSDMRKTALVITIVCLLLTIIANISAFSLNSTDDTPKAVIMAEMVVVRSAPDSSSTELTKIHEGLTVKVIEKIGDWVKIEASNGNDFVGWVRAESLEHI